MRMWERLESAWGPARDVRDHQPLLALSRHPNCDIDAGVRQVRPDELDAYLVAAVDMFIGEVGVDPASVTAVGVTGAGWPVSSRPAARGPASSTARWCSRPRSARSRRGGPDPGVWVHPEWRGLGLGTAGTATVAAVIVGSGRTASLYVNDFNTVARAAYARVGFAEIGTFATVLLD